VLQGALERLEHTEQRCRAALEQVESAKTTLSGLGRRERSPSVRDRPRLSLCNRYVPADSLSGYGSPSGHGSVSGYGSLDRSASSQHLHPGAVSPVRAGDLPQPKSILKKSNSNIESGSITYVDSTDKSYDSFTDEEFKYFFEDDDDVGIVVSKSVESSTSLPEDDLLSLASNDPADASSISEHPPVMLKDSGIAITPDNHQSRALSSKDVEQIQSDDREMADRRRLQVTGNAPLCSTVVPDSSTTVINNVSLAKTVHVDDISESHLKQSDANSNNVSSRKGRFSDKSCAEVQLNAHVQSSSPSHSKRSNVRNSPSSKLKRSSQENYSTDSIS